MMRPTYLPSGRLLHFQSGPLLGQSTAESLLRCPAFPLQANWPTIPVTLGQFQPHSPGVPRHLLQPRCNTRAVFAASNITAWLTASLSDLPPHISRALAQPRNAWAASRSIKSICTQRNKCWTAAANSWNDSFGCIPALRCVLYATARLSLHKGPSELRRCPCTQLQLLHCVRSRLLVTAIQRARACISRGMSNGCD
jgi:hypothetical protein